MRKSEWVCLVGGLHFYGVSCVSGRAWLFSIFRLCNSMDMACCMAMVLMFLKVFLIGSMGILKVSASIFIDGINVVARAPAVRTIRGSTFQPNAMVSSMRGWYLSILFLNVSGENRSLQYVIQ